MTAQKMCATLVLTLVAILTSCAAASDQIGVERKLTVKVSPDDPANPSRIRFDVDGTPYASLQDQRLTMNERIRLGMRRLAAEQLNARGLCPQGFKGPELVLGRKMGGEYFFFVECLPSKAE